MAVMHVRHVRMSVDERFVAVRVAVRLGRIHVRRMLVSVMLVVDVAVVVLEWLVGMQVLVAIADQEADTERHQQRGDHVRQVPTIAEQGNRENGSCKRRGGEHRRLRVPRRVPATRTRPAGC